MSNATDATPEGSDLPAVTGETGAVLGVVADFLAKMGHEIPLETARSLTETEAYQLGMVAAFTEDRGPGLRAAVGAYLLGQKDPTKHGDWGAWLQDFAVSVKKSVRTLDRWMLEAQERYGLPAPKGAIPSQRGPKPKRVQSSPSRVEDPGLSVIEATAVAVPKPTPSATVAGSVGEAPDKAPDGDGDRAGLLKGATESPQEPTRTDEAPPIARDQAAALLDALAVLVDAQPLALARLARSHRTKVKAAETALTTALAQTADPVEPRRAGTIKRPGQAAQAVETARPGEATTNAAPVSCDHPKGKVRVLAMGSICDACGAFKRAGVWQATA